MTKEEESVESLYVTLNKQYNAGDYQKAIATARKINKSSKDDLLPLKCVAVCQLQSERYSDCIETITKKKLGMPFEHAYCMYRLNRTEQSEKILRSVESPELREKELLAQVLYRLEKFDECVAIYEELLREQSDENDDERMSNYAAALAAREQVLAQSEFLKKADSLIATSEESYELLYNKACGFAASGCYEKAESLLERSIKVFKEVNSGELTEEELNEELAILRIQLGYVNQLLDRASAANELYSQASKSLVNDAGLSAVIANNLLTLSNSGNVFEAKKKLKAMTAAAAQSKLSTAQKRLLDCNTCIHMLNTKQLELCKKKLQHINETYPDDASIIPRINAAVLVKEKKYQEALRRIPDSPGTELLRAQIYLQQGVLTQACQVLRDCQYNNRLAIVSALVALYLSFEEMCSVDDVVAGYLDRVNISERKDDAVTTVLRNTAQALMDKKCHKPALSHLEKLIEITGPDNDVLAMLITCAAQIDKALVKKYSKNLPTVEDFAADCDIEALHKSSDLFMRNKYNIRKAAKPAAAPTSVDIIAKKKKRKKKIRLPKNYDPEKKPDPERWLPKWERSAFKKLQKKKRRQGDDIGKGSQGTAAGSSASYDYSGRPAPAAKADAPDSPKPGTSGGARPKNAKDKRRGGGGGGGRRR